MTSRATPAFDLDALRAAVGAGEIDTVLVAFPDLQGRLVGKRVVASYFLSQLEHNGGAVEACDYLFAVDVDMEVLEGFRFANWDRGYGDVVCTPDLGTLHLVPWLDATALVICDVGDHHGQPAEVSPRRILRRQTERAAAAGYTVKTGTELEFFLFDDSLDDVWRKGFRDLSPSAPYVLDYHILQTTKDEWFIRRLRNAMVGAGLPVEFSKGEAGRGQHELNLRYAEALECADNHTIYKNGAKELAALADVSVTFMAKWAFEEVGSSCHIHSSLWDRDTDRSLMAGDDPSEMSEVFRWWLGGLLHTAGDFALLWAPYVNSYKRFQPGSWAPTAIGWGADNRTLGFRVVGHGQGLRVESRIPGADCNPYLALAGTIAGGLYGIENRIDCGDPHVGNGYESDLPRIPHSLVDAINRFRASDIARETLGEDVWWHICHLAEAEWAAFSRTVTDWELRRGFEQL